MTPPDIEQLIDLLNARGGSAYFGEPVSILEHSCRLPTPPPWPELMLRQSPPFYRTTSATCCTDSTSRLLTAAKTACNEEVGPPISPAGSQRR